VFAQNSYTVRTHRSLVDLAYRIVDAAAIIAAALIAADHTPGESLPYIAAIAATTLLVHSIAIEISGLYRNWRGSNLSLELWCVLTNWVYTAPAVLGVGLLTQYNAQLTYATKVLWLLVTPAAMASGRIVLRSLLRKLRKRGFNTRRFAICGVNKLAMQLARNVQNTPELGLDFVGYFDDRPESRTEESAGESQPHAGNLAELVELARSGRVDMIFITFPMRA
jgi:putative colanic acid biosynthesis UDP-glucose lipid carrier transferase